jgi:hypothetical protein
MLTTDIALTVKGRQLAAVIEKRLFLSYGIPLNFG